MKRGFTLLELILVLAILVMVSGFAIPTYQAYILSNEITGGAGKLELEVRKARLQAIRTGQIQMMQVALNGRQVTLQPWLSADDATSAAGGATVMTEMGQVVSTDAMGTVESVGVVNGTQWSLGESVAFESAQVFTDLRSAVQTGTVDTSAAAGLSSPILFYPDGSTSTARIVITNQRGRRIAVELRGVTGSTQVLELVPGAGLMPTAEATP